MNGFAFCTIKLLFVEKSLKKIVSNMFRKQLLLSDSTMGVFFLMLSVYDFLYRNDFVAVGHLWKKSIHCRVLSLVSTLSVEMTLFGILIIGIERFIAMCFPLKNIHISVKTAWFIITSAWLAAFIISFAPFLYLYLNNIALNNAMCIIVLLFDRLDLWIVATMYAINTIVTLVSIVLHAGVIRAVHNMQHNKTVTQARRSRKHSVTIRIVLLILTNSSRWLVLGIVGLLHMTGISISQTIFAGIVTAVLPISAILNPILNVFTTTEFFDTIQIKCKKS